MAAECDSTRRSRRRRCPTSRRSPRFRTSRPSPRRSPSVTRGSWPTSPRARRRARSSVYSRRLGTRATVDLSALMLGSGRRAADRRQRPTRPGRRGDAPDPRADRSPRSKRRRRDGRLDLRARGPCRPRRRGRRAGARVPRRAGRRPAPRGSTRSWTEVPYTLRIDEGYATGRIDLVFEEAGKLVVVDWKSDTVGPAASRRRPRRTAPRRRHTREPSARRPASRSARSCSSSRERSPNGHLRLIDSSSRAQSTAASGCASRISSMNCSSCPPGMEASASNP